MATEIMRQPTMTARATLRATPLPEEVVAVSRRRAEGRRRLRESIDFLLAPGRGYAFVPMIVMQAFLLAGLLEPAPAHEQTSALNAAIGWLGVGALTLGMFSYLLAGGRGRLSLAIALPATLVLLAMTIACPLSGHHTWGAWVAGSWGIAFAATALHLGALTRSLRRSD